MAVVARITEIYPVHDVLALADVTIDGMCTICGVQLARNRRTNQYRISLPTLYGHRSPFLKIQDSELQQKITDAIASKYEYKLRERKRSPRYSNLDEIEEDRIYKLKRHRRT